MRQIALSLVLLVLVSACNRSTEPVHSWLLVPQGVTAAALDDNTALLASIEQGAQLWQLKPKQIRRHFRHGQSPQQNMISVFLSKNRQYALTADRKGLAWWSIDQGKALKSWALDGIQKGVLSADGQWALLGLADKAVYLSLAAGKTRFVFPHDRMVKAVALDETGRYALTGGDDGMAKLWDLNDGKMIHRWQLTGKLATVALSPQGTYALTNSLLGQLKIWNTGDGKLVRTLGPRNITATAAVFSDKEGFLVTGHPSQGINLWSLKSGKQLRHFEPKRPDRWRPSASPVLALAFVDQSRQLLSATSDGAVQQWVIKGK